MRAKAPVLKTFAREAFERGVPLREIARVADLPLGTVKVWRSRGKWVRRVKVKPGTENWELKTENCELVGKGAAGRDETSGTVEKKGGDETHRGLRACHMPGRRASKQLTFSMFKRGMWPPAVWKVPPGIVGGELLMLLQERSCMGLVGKKRSGVSQRNGEQGND
jgi:hypothetical protein